MNIQRASLTGIKITPIETPPAPVTADWEILYVYNFYGHATTMLIDSNLNCTCYEESHDITGSLLKYVTRDQQGYNRVYANSECTASYGDSTASTLANTTYQSDDFIISLGQTLGSKWALFVLAKKSSSARIPYEIGLYWNDKSSASGEGCVIKANEAQFISRTGDAAVGDKLQIGYVPSGLYLNTVSVSNSFNGKIKNADVDTSGYWQEISGTSGTVLTVATGIALAIPQ